MSVRMGPDPLCHMPKPKAGHHRWHQHRHLRVGDGNLQGEGKINYTQTGKVTAAQKTHEDAKSESLSRYLTERSSFTFDGLCSGTAGTTGSHRRCNVSDGIIGVPHRCERLPGSNLHHLGPQQTFLCYSTQGASGTRLSSVHQRTDGESENAGSPPFY